MSFSKEDLRRILNTPSIKIHDDELKWIYKLVGLTVKEHRVGFGGKEYNYEVHFKRLYVVRIFIDTSKSVSFRNEYINFGEEGTHGISFGGVVTVKELFQILFSFIHKLCPNYSPIIDVEDEEELPVAQELIDVFNQEVFKDA